MFSNPKSNVAQLGLEEGMKVADFGAGMGHYAIAASEKVGHTGRVYAVEVQKDMLKRLEQEIKDKNIKNIDCIWGDIEKEDGTKLADQSQDRVIISNVLFQSSDKLGLIDEAKRILKLRGKVLLIDWKESFQNIGPIPAHVVTESHARALFEKRGFKFEESISTSDHHYGIIFILQ